MELMEAGILIPFLIARLDRSPWDILDVHPPQPPLDWSDIQALMHLRSASRVWKMWADDYLEIAAIRLAHWDLQQLGPRRSGWSPDATTYILRQYEKNCRVLRCLCLMFAESGLPEVGVMVPQCLGEFTCEQMDQLRGTISEAEVEFMMDGEGFCKGSTCKLT